MSNKEKRAKRAKIKAKTARVIKQKESSKKTVNEVVFMSPEMISLFETLPTPTPEFLYIYQLKVFASEKLNSDDLEGDVAGLSILYCHWFSTEGDRMLASELTSISANLVENDVFLKAFNSTH